MQPTFANDEKTPTLIASVSRALAVLDCIGSSSRPLPAKSIARATALSLGTTYNVLRTLAHSNYVVQDHDGFVLGPGHPALAAAGGAVSLAQGRTVLNGIRDELRAATYLSRFYDGEIELVDIVDGPLTPRVDLWVGLQDGAHATAFGKQILAGLGAGERLEYVSSHPLAELTPYTITSPREFLRTLEGSPSSMLDDQEYALGFTCLAVPVAASSWAGALAISLPAGEQRRGMNYTETLKDAAAHLELILGAGGTISAGPTGQG
ncbi:DNA-binding IclR family transcriptional regulator [Arthrobacter silviterrae]|uniref:Helix-turn-helix domain-containing protein n=1 Tax=Arthrobacter silviterrae TaxID=2026658 RepID=A0ABX0DBZ6_9MICC|nr:MULTISPECIES: IclR family transcriptional regulator C-terminal domain-containing protein [Arthrobacter]MCU6480923.1 helix-turn-helix domain-containing protein [Arthrobacter sp. A2-55]MDQ0279013.1 DNA-binding IclR family transcriptional regulator [Arthrobacter silviterrae]NGN84431.1 helix-turn-helix domain-containing protein [Arthrobacter silviterrae]